MNLGKRLLTRCGIVVVVSVAVMSASVGHATMASISGLTAASTNITTAQEEADEPLDVRIKQAIAELREEARAALVELGELDTPEKAEEAIQILQRMKEAIEELNGMLHNRVEERLEEQNDLAIARIYQNSAAETKELGAVTPVDQIEKIDKIRAIRREKVTRIEENFRHRLTRLEEPHNHRPLPKSDLRRQGRLEPPSHASEEEIEEFIAGLREKAEAALDNLGELDTPGKTQRAENIRIQMERRIEHIENRAGDQLQQDLETTFARGSEALQQRAQAAVDALELRPKSTLT